ncbi:MAG: MFS transporter, partial [Burkholderiaceae bacterium]
ILCPMPSNGLPEVFPASLLKLLRGEVTPGVQHFAVLGGIEAIVRGIGLSVYPLLMYRALGDAAMVAQIYFMVGLLSLLAALAVPQLTRRLPRRWVYTLGVSLYLVSAGLAMVGGRATVAALLCQTLATATAFVCFNAYVLDHVAKTEFSRLESLRLLYGGVGWTVGPVLGVWLLQFWQGAPFVIVGLAAMVMLTVFWLMRLGDGRRIGDASKASSYPWAYLPRFFSQPRLVAGWFFAVMRSCAWWIYIVYVGIFAVQNGLGEQIGGIATSLANLGLFFAPLMLRWMMRRSVRAAVRTGFAAAAGCFTLAAVFSPLPWATVAVLMLGSYFLVLLDICGGLPFLMSVKPSQRTEMSAVYSSFRDVSGILSPGIAWLVLQFSPVPGVFAAGAVALLAAWWVAGGLHPELGVPGSQRVRERPGRIEHPAR